jgi:hypothetical protein
MVIFQCLVKNYKVSAGVGWHIPPIPALRRQRQKDQEFKVISGCLRNLNSDERREGGEGGKVGREKDGRKEKKEKQEGRGSKEERRGGRKKGKRKKERKKEDREREKGGG